MDKELDDLLDSALDDFGNKATPLTAGSNAATSLASSSNITVEKTNLYVDDIDYDDRPSPQTSKASSTTTQPKTAPPQGHTSSANSNTFDFKLSDDEMKMFDEIFNDSKTKETMKQINEAMSMFKTGGDEAKLLENFQKVMSQLNDFDLGDEENEDEDDEGDDQTQTAQGADPLKGVDFDFLKNLTAGFAPTGATSATANSPKSSSQENKSSLNATAADSSTEGEKKQSTLDKVLEDMNKNSERVLKNDKFPFGSDLLSKLLSTAQEDKEDGDDLDAESSLMLEPLLNMLFSKEILYPSLKMMSENYDKYLVEQKEKLSEDEYAKCVSQKECIREMCVIYESSNETDSSEEKTEKLKKVLDLLEKCGVSLLLSFFLFDSMRFIF
jgi:peroxin-19